MNSKIDIYEIINFIEEVIIDLYKEDSSEERAIMARGLLEFDLPYLRTLVHGAHEVIE